LVESKTTEWRDVVNPATQEVLARVPFATPDEVNAAVANAKEAFKTWRKTPIGARARIFLKLQQLIRENMKELAALLTAEQGKTLPDAEGDVFRGLEVVEHAASIGNLQLGELANNVANGVDTYTCCSRWACAPASPLQLPGHDSAVDVPHGHRHGQHLRAQALRAGPHGHHAPGELALEAGIPPGVLNVVHGGEDVVNAICDHPDIKAISFVGSTKVGTHVYNRASLNGKRVQCMMGAKNHAIVMPDANKEQTLNALLAPPSARPASAAWRCRWWCWWAKRKVDSRSGGQGQDPQGQRRHRAGTDVGPLVSCAALSRVEGLIERGVADGATLELDGRNPRCRL
jgi:malonate-semialdehyde dehydrogenase (acetylating)/methylmalonate-semialdehyde dehydrogenase